MTDNTFNPEATPNGIRMGSRVIGWSGAVRQFDGTRFDGSNSEGLLWLACIQEAKAAGWLTLPVEKEIILWRWLVVTVFINEEMEKNGTVDIQNDESGIDTAVIYSGKHGAISIYPAPERFALAHHVEGCAVEKYGTKTGLLLALHMYQDMVTGDPKQGLKLTAMGREGMDLLHDSFIEQVQTEGTPDMPVMH